MTFKEPTELRTQAPTSGHGVYVKDTANANQGDLRIDLQAHQICMCIPAGSTVDANTVKLPGGILILGALRGNVYCATGTAVIAKGGEFQGILEANNIIVEGTITSPMSASGRPAPISVIKARGQRDVNNRMVGGIVALGEKAFVCANMSAIAYSIPLSADLGLSVMQTITS